MVPVSVLLCVYNGRDVLRDSLDSILGQSFADFEFVIVDDGSTDGTPELLQQYAGRDPRIHVIRQANAGLTRALNVGLGHCTGRYIARQDADDVSEPDRLARQLAYMKHHPDVLLSGTDYRVFDDDSHLLAEVRNSRRRKLRRRMQSCNQLVHGTLMFQRVIAGDAVRFDDYYYKAQDYDLALRMMEQGRIAIVPDLLYRWRFSSHGILASNVNFYGERARKNHLLRLAGKPEDKSMPSADEIRDRPSRWSFQLAKGARLLSGYEKLDARACYRAALQDPDMTLEARRYCERRLLLTYAPRFLLQGARELI